MRIDSLALFLTFPALGLAVWTIYDCRHLAAQLKALTKTAMDQMAQLNALATTAQAQIEHAERQNQRLVQLSSALEIQEKRAQTLVGFLDRIWRALTTHHIGQFPAYMPKIAELIAKAAPGGTLRIMCNFYGHGSFSAMSDWSKTKLEVEQAHARGVEIFMICTDRAVREQLLKWQFAKHFSNWGHVLTSLTSDFARQVAAFVPLGWRKTLPSMTNDDLLNLMMDDEETIKRNVFRFAEVLELTQRVPTYLWIVDDSAAIISFPTQTFNENGPEELIASAVMTEDKAIVQSLVQYFSLVEVEARNAQAALKERNEVTCPLCLTHP